MSLLAITQSVIFISEYSILLSSNSLNQYWTGGGHHCSNRLFLAILLCIVLLVLGAIAITLILVLTGRDKGQISSLDDQLKQQIVLFGGCEIFIK
jgi:hypothetical protein